MKQVQQNYRSGELMVADVPAPRVRPGAILVGTNVSLISSGTEKQLVDLAKASLAGKAIARPDLVRQVMRNVKRDGLRATAEKVLAKLDAPIPLGYSLAGEVLEVGRNVSGYAVGDRVACAGAGLANHAEYNVVPKNLSVRIPSGVSDEDASFVTLGAIALQGVRQAEPTLGERFVVMGLGLIGLLTVQLLKANGCAVLGYDPDMARANLARELGADVVATTGLSEAVMGFSGIGADAVILTASTKSNEPINTAAEISRLKGRIVVVGMVGMAVERELFYRRELDLKLSMSYGPGRYDPSYEDAGNDYPPAYVRWTEQRNMEAFLDLVAAGRVTPQKLITHRFDIDRAEEAYGMMDGREPHLAMLLNYPQDLKPPQRQLPCSGQRQRRAIEGTARVGFVGLGSYAKSVLLPAIRKVPGVSFTHVATSTGISARNAGERYGFTSMATDPAHVIDADDTDIVFITTRHNTHAELTVAALEAGKHVFCEKPLALDAEQLHAVVAACSRSLGILTVGFNRRFSPLLLKARDALRTRSAPLMMMYRVNAGEVPNDSWIQREEGGGRIVGEICHFVDSLAFLSGSVPIEVQAVKTGDQDDAVSILLRFADGSTGTIVYATLGDPSVPKEYIEVFSRGMVVQLTDFVRLDITRGGRTRTTKSAQDKGQKALIKAFLAAARGETDAPVALDQMAAVTETTFAIEEAVGTARAITVNRLQPD